MKKTEGITEEINNYAKNLPGINVVDLIDLS